MHGLIYKATSKSGKVYIGLTSRTLEYRRKSHLFESTKNSRTHFHRAIRKYGADHFKWEIVRDGFTTKESLECAEIFYISLYNTYYDGYNMTRGGKSKLGVKVSKAQINKQLKTLNTIQESGLTRAQEIGVKSSKTKKENGSCKGKNNGFYGKNHTKETKEKMQKPKKNTEKMQKTTATRLKISVANKGQLKSDSAKLNMKIAKANEPYRTCPHCDMTGKGGNMTRYHFNNCKFKKLSNIII